MISLRGLVVACREVAASLSAGDLTAARRLLGYHLVSRPTGTLDRAHVASATIESASENLTDAFVAPLCFYVVLGLAGAWAYRAINTADAMIGYRDAELEFLGKASARLDDLCNLIPARIAGLAIVVSALLAGGRAGAAWATMVRDHRRPASPNAGWTMAAMAGALGVVLEKAGAYRLGTGKYPDCPDIERGLRIMVGAAVGTTAGLLGLILLRNYSR
jgi:adenosylcobinamide-phosphate synthase